MTNEVKISDAEWEIMRIVWDKPNLTGSEIVDLISPKRDWNYRTVKTLISRLVTKGVLKYDKKGNTYYYSPAISKKVFMRKESQSFIRKVFDGATRPMLAYLVNQSNLSKDEIKELKKILNKKEKKK